MALTEEPSRRRRIWVVDGSLPPDDRRTMADRLSGLSTLWQINRRTFQPSGRSTAEEIMADLLPSAVLSISAKHGSGVDALKDIAPPSREEGPSRQD